MCVILRNLVARRGRRFGVGSSAMLIAGVFAAASSPGIAGPPPLPGYHFTIIQMDPGLHPGSQLFTVGESLNNHGQVVGRFGLQTPGSYLWSEQDGGQSLSSLFGTAFVPEGLAISDDGRIVGSYRAEGASHHAPFVGHTDGSFAPLAGTFPHDHGAAVAVRGDHIAGIGAIGSEDSSRAVHWHGGNATDLGTLGSPWSFSRGVNSDGVVVGMSPGGDGFNLPFRWTLSGGMQQLALPSGTGTGGAWAITDSGYTVGDTASVVEPWRVATVWGPDGSFETLPWYFNDGNFSQAEALAVNESLQVVGIEFHPLHGPNAVLWQDGHAYLLSEHVPDLPVGVQLFRALDINDHGQILINGHDPISREFFSVLLTPIPTPSTGVVFAGAALTLARRRRR